MDHREVYPGVRQPLDQAVEGRLLVALTALVTLGLCLAPLGFGIGIVAHVIALDRHVSQIERRTRVLEHPRRRATSVPTPVPVVRPVSAECDAAEPVVPLWAGYYLVRSGALSCAVEHAGGPTHPPIVRWSPTSQPVGLRVEGVRTDGLAAMMGLQDGDVVTRVDGVPVGSPSNLDAAFGRALSRHRLDLTLRRSGRIRTLRYVIDP